MAAEEVTNEQPSDELRSLRQRLRKLRRKQVKKPALKKTDHAEVKKNSSEASAAPSSDFAAAKEWVQRREKKREERSRRSRKKPARRSSDSQSQRSSGLQTTDLGSNRSLSKSEHGSFRCHNLHDVDESEVSPPKPRRSSYKNIDVADQPYVPKKSRRSHQTIDDSEEFSLKQTKKSHSKDKRRSRSSKKNSKERSKKPSSDEGSKCKTYEKPKPTKRLNHISVDFSEVPSLSSHAGRRNVSGELSCGNQESHLDDNDSLFNDDASIETYWGERYFQLQSEYTAEEALEMLREEKEMMRLLEAEKRELERDMEEAKQQRTLLKKSLSKRHMLGKENSKRLEKDPYGNDDETASQATWDDRSVSTYASSIVGSMFSKPSVHDGDDAASTTGRSVTSGISSAVNKWFPNLQNEVGTETEREQLKMRRNLAQAKKERDVLRKKLAKRTEQNARLLHKLEKMEGVPHDNDSLLDSCADSQAGWDDESVSTMGTSRSFVSAIFHPKILGEASLLSTGR